MADRDTVDRFAQRLVKQSNHKLTHEQAKKEAVKVAIRADRTRKK